MPRQSRKESGTGIYHVMMRGINHQSIFNDEEDYYQFITTLDRSVFVMTTKALHVGAIVLIMPIA